MNKWSIDYWMERFWPHKWNTDIELQKQREGVPLAREERPSPSTAMSEPLKRISITGYESISGVGVPAGTLSINMNAGNTHRSWIWLGMWMFETANPANTQNEITTHWELFGADALADVPNQPLWASDATTQRTLVYSNWLPVNELQLNIWNGANTYTFVLAGIWKEDR